MGSSQRSDRVVVDEVTGEIIEQDEASQKKRMPAHLKRHLLRVQGGKMYLPAAFRLVWFRDECPIDEGWGIMTEIKEGGVVQNIVSVQASIINPGGIVVAQAHKTETKEGFPQGFLEKAETGAIARALAMCGYGTQFSPELDEEDHVADAPVDPSGQRRAASGQQQYPRTSTATRVAEYMESQGQQYPTQTPVGEIVTTWEGPGQCPRCHAPAGKRHGKPCV